MKNLLFVLIGVILAGGVIAACSYGQMPGMMRGMSHEQMRAMMQGNAPTEAVVATLPAEWTMEAAMEFGEKVYTANCAACHQANGEGLPPAFPGLKGAPLVVGAPAGHIDIVLKGKAGTAMPSFGYLSDADLAAVITYERNSWGNSAGDVVSPEDIAAAR